MTRYTMPARLTKKDVHKWLTTRLNNTPPLPSIARTDEAVDAYGLNDVDGVDNMEGGAA